MSSPLYKITELGSTAKNHSTELTDYLVNKNIRCKYTYQGCLSCNVVCSACDDHHYHHDNTYR